MRLKSWNSSFTFYKTRSLRKLKRHHSPELTHREIFSACQTPARGKQMASNCDVRIVPDELNFIWNEPSPTLQHQHAANGIKANSKWHKVSNRDFMPDCWCSYTRKTFRCLIKTVLMLLYPDVTGARLIQSPKRSRNTCSLFLTNTEQDLLPPQVIHSNLKNF